MKDFHLFPPAHAGNLGGTSATSHQYSQPQPYSRQHQRSLSPFSTAPTSILTPRGGPSHSHASSAAAEANRLLRDRKRWEAQQAEERYVQDLEQENAKMVDILQHALPKKLEQLWHNVEKLVDEKVDSFFKGKVEKLEAFCTDDGSIAAAVERSWTAKESAFEKALLEKCKAKWRADVPEVVLPRFFSPLVSTAEEDKTAGGGGCASTTHQVPATSISRLNLLSTSSQDSAGTADEAAGLATSSETVPVDEGNYSEDMKFLSPRAVSSPTEEVQAEVTEDSSPSTVPDPFCFDETALSRGRSRNDRNRDPRGRTSQSQDKSKKYEPNSVDKKAVLQYFKTLQTQLDSSSREITQLDAGLQHTEQKFEQNLQALETRRIPALLDELKQSELSPRFLCLENQMKDLVREIDTAHQSFHKMRQDLDLEIGTSADFRQNILCTEQIAQLRAEFYDHLCGGGGGSSGSNCASSAFKPLATPTSLGRSVQEQEPEAETSYEVINCATTGQHAFQRFRGSSSFENENEVDHLHRRGMIHRIAVQVFDSELAKYQSAVLDKNFVQFSSEVIARDFPRLQAHVYKIAQIVQGHLGTTTSCGAVVGGANKPNRFSSSSQTSSSIGSTPDEHSREDNVGAEQEQLEPFAGIIIPGASSRAQFVAEANATNPLSATTLLEQRVLSQVEQLLQQERVSVDHSLQQQTKITEAKIAHAVETSEQKQTYMRQIESAENCKETQQTVAITTKNLTQKVQQSERVLKLQFDKVSAENVQLKSEFTKLWKQVCGPAEFRWVLPKIDEKCLKSGLFPLKHITAVLHLYPAGRLCSRPGYCALVLKRVPVAENAAGSTPRSTEKTSSVSPAGETAGGFGAGAAETGVSTSGSGTSVLITPRGTSANNPSRNPFEVGAAAEANPFSGRKSSHRCNQFLGGFEDSSLPLTGRMKVQFLFDEKICCASEQWDSFEGCEEAVVIDNFLPGDRLRNNLAVTVRVIQA